MKPKSLDEIVLEDYYDHFSEGPLDSKIINLVKAVTYFGDGTIMTTASCQGHLCGSRYSFPWICIWPSQDCIMTDYSKMVESLKKTLKHTTDVHQRAYLKYKIESAKKSLEFYDVIRAYNGRSPVKWQLQGTWLRPSYDAKSAEELETMQQDADKLAQYIFEVCTKQSERPKKLLSIRHA